MIGLCMGLAGAVWAQLPLPAFTLAWTHTIEKIRWEEDYRVTPSGLLLGEARIKGTGAAWKFRMARSCATDPGITRTRFPRCNPCGSGEPPKPGITNCAMTSVVTP